MQTRHLNHFRLLYGWFFPQTQFLPSSWTLQTLKRQMSKDFGCCMFLVVILYIFENTLIVNFPAYQVPFIALRLDHDSATCSSSVHVVIHTVYFFSALLCVLGFDVTVSKAVTLQVLLMTRIMVITSRALSVKHVSQESWDVLLLKSSICRERSLPERH